MSKKYIGPSVPALNNVTKPADPKAAAERLAQKYGAKPTNVMILVDATGSMEPVWSSTKKILDELVVRVKEIAKCSFKFVAYRDYVDGANILAVSPWAVDSAPLRSFLAGITCEGGGNNEGEAVERAIEEAASDKQTSLVILIGDEPPLDLAKCLRYATQLKQASISINAFSVLYGDSFDPRTEAAFRQISLTTNGVYARLTNVKDLLDIIAMSAAKAAKGDAGVREYMTKHEHQLSQGSKNVGTLLLGPPKK